VSDPIADPSELPGTVVHDQLGRKLGKVERVYAPGGEGDVMWATLDVSDGLFNGRIVFVPLARLKHEDGVISVPYSRQFIQDAPEVENSDEVSPEDDKLLRDYYGVSRGDGSIRADNEDSYAAQVPEGDEPSRPI
jgi:hypothetical protein